MKIFIFADNLLGYEVLKYLYSINENIVGVAIHPKRYQNYSDKIKKITKKTKLFTFNSKISEKKINQIKELKPDIILVVYWRFILKKNLFSIPTFGAINFHMGYLPFNRGANPNVWPIIEDTPAGFTIHKIDENVDSGEIIIQKKIKHTILDTGYTIHNKLIRNFIELFKENWKQIKKKKFKGKKQNLKKGTFHYRKHFQKISKIKLNKKISIINLINILRAKMFSKHDPAFFYLNKKKYFIDIKIRKA
jgi:methionyl-tRNA formyltransferase